MEKRSKRGRLKQTFKILRRVAEVRGHREAPFHIRRNEILGGYATVAVRERATTWLRSKPFAIRAVNG